MDDAMLKDKEEVQDYLKNLCTEYKYSCYGEKNPEGKSERSCPLVVLLRIVLDQLFFLSLP